jgi:two-component system nitrate/nitrite response regulator NarL
MDDISREGLTFILEKEGFNILQSGESVDDLTCTTSAAEFLTILDCGTLVGQPGAVQRARERLSASRVVVVSDKFDLNTVIDCFNVGAHGYIIRSAKSNRMIAALRLVALGEKVVPSDFVETIGGYGIEHVMNPEAGHEMEAAKLSPRELDVLCCLMAGYPNKVIARKLDVCEATVKVHVKAILRKLNVCNRTQAALWANSHGIHEPVLSS